MLGLGLALGAQDLRIQVLATTDTRGHILAQEPFTLQPQAQGWAKLATLVQERRARQPHTLLVDCGDALQGAPLAAIRALTRPDLPDAAVTVMNGLGWHGMVVGNRDLDFGLKALRATEEQAQFPFLAANLLDRATGKPAFAPYAIQTLGGLRVALLGLCAAPVSGEAGLLQRDLVETLRSWEPLLRDKEKADLVVVLLHRSAGEAGPASPLEQLNKATGIDLIVAGPGLTLPAPDVRATPVLVATPSGLAAADLSLVKEKGRWRVTRAQVSATPLEVGTPTDPLALEKTSAQREAAEAYLDTFATQLRVDLDGRWSRMEDTPLLQLLHAAQRQACPAQLSAVTIPSPRYFVPAGPTSVRQFWALAPDEAKVARIRVSGAQLKAYLEHAARTFHFSYHADLFNKEVPLADVDNVDGPTYHVDLGRPVGQRIVELKVQGKPVQADQVFTLALPAHRLEGSGGYIQAIGWKGQPEFVTRQSFRNALLTHVLERPALEPVAAQRWRTVPYLDRERVLAQQLP